MNDFALLKFNSDIKLACLLQDAKFIDIIIDIKPSLMSKEVFICFYNKD